MALLALFAPVAVAVPSLEVRGADFVNPATGNRFQIVGVAYQPGGSSGYNPGHDPLSDGSACLRDAAIMQRLGVNAIRVYNLDPAVSRALLLVMSNGCPDIFLLGEPRPLCEHLQRRGNLYAS